MKIEKSFFILAMLVMGMLSFPIHAKELKSDENTDFRELKALGEELDAEGFQVPDASNVRTYSNPKLRPVEVVQPDEYIEYEAAGLIPSPFLKNTVTEGWLVNGCVVIAPRHAIVDKGYVGKDLSNVEVDFKVGYQGKGSFKQQVKIKPIFCGQGNIDDGLAGSDFCIYKTDRSLKGLVKPIKIGAIDYQRWDVVPTVSVGFFPQASGRLDVLAKDMNSKIVEGDSSYLESRAAVISGAGLTQENPENHVKYLIGMQVGNFKVVNSARVLQEMRSLVAKNKDALMCH